MGIDNDRGGAPTVPVHLKPDELGDVGRVLYGERWQTALADALGVTDRALRYWLNGSVSPDITHVRRIVALLERMQENAADLVGRLRKRADRAASEAGDESWSFAPRELELVGDTRVRHIPTGTSISFYRYVEQPPADYVPSGIISNVGMFSGGALRRFQAAAWKLMRRYRYG
jgi:hypothetical protein